MVSPRWSGLWMSRRQARFISSAMISRVGYVAEGELATTRPALTPASRFGRFPAARWSASEPNETGAWSGKMVLLLGSAAGGRLARPSPTEETIARTGGRADQ